MSPFPALERPRQATTGDATPDARADGVWGALRSLWSAIHQAAQPAARSPGELADVLRRWHGPWSLSLAWPESIVPEEWRLSESPRTDRAGSALDRSAVPSSRRLPPLQSDTDQRSHLRALLIDVQRRLTTDNILWMRRSLSPWSPVGRTSPGAEPDDPDSFCIASNYAVMFALAASRVDGGSFDTLPDLLSHPLEWQPTGGDLIAVHRLLEELVLRRAAAAAPGLAAAAPSRTAGGLRNSAVLEACGRLLTRRAEWVEILGRPPFLPRANWYSARRRDPEVQQAGEERAFDDLWWRAFGVLLTASPLTALAYHDLFGRSADRSRLRTLWETGAPEGAPQGVLVPGRWTEFWQTQLARTLVAVVRNPVPSAGNGASLAELTGPGPARRSRPSVESEHRSRLEHLAALLDVPLPPPRETAVQPAPSPQASAAPMASPSAPASVSAAAPAIPHDPAARALHYRFLDLLVRRLVVSQTDALERVSPQERGAAADRAAPRPSPLESPEGPCFGAFVESVFGASLVELSQAHWTLSDATRRALRTLFDPHWLRTAIDDPRDVRLSDAARATGIEEPFLRLFQARVDEPGIPIPTRIPNGRDAPAASVRSLLAGWVTEILNRTPQPTTTSVVETRGQTS